MAPHRARANSIEGFLLMSARCVYCDSELRPNSMFCLSCGQLVAGAYPPVPSGIQQPVATGAPTPATQSRPAAPNTPVPLPPPIGGAPEPVASTPAAPAESAPVAAPATSAPQPLTAVKLHFSTGDHAIVSGTAVIGRGPQSAAQNSGAQAVEVKDTTRSVSRVHLTLTVRDGAATVTDMGSANGSAVERAGARTPLVEGRAVAVAAGDRIWLGDVSAEISAG